MTKFCFRITVLLCGVFVLTGCLTAGNGADSKAAAGESLGFPVLDGLSSASILRVDDKTLVYVGDRTAGSYRLNKVDINTPSKISASRDIGDNVAILTAKNGKIALIGAAENGYEDFSGRSIKIYDANTLRLVQNFPFNPDGLSGGRPAPTFDTLHHRDPGLGLGDKYAAVISIYESGANAIIGKNGAADVHQHYISVYDITGRKAPSYTKAYTVKPATDPAEFDTTVLGAIGTPVSVATHGDYLIAGGSAGTGVYKIDAGGTGLAIALDAGIGIRTPGSHWMKDNGSYVLESAAGDGTVRVWKWNGAGAPALVGTIAAQNSGSVQALSFGFGAESNNVYIFAKGSNDTGFIKVVDLTNPASFANPTVLFKYPDHKGTSLSGIWNIEVRKTGSDSYYVLTGGYGSTGIVLVFKNPPTDGSAAAPLPDEVEYFSAVRTMKTFVSSDGTIYYAAKNYTTQPVDTAAYRLDLVPVN